MTSHFILDLQCVGQRKADCPRWCRGALGSVQMAPELFQKKS